MRVSKEFTKLKKVTYEKNKLTVTLEDTNDGINILLSDGNDTLSLLINRWAYDFDYMVEFFDRFSRALEDEL